MKVKDYNELYNSDIIRYAGMVITVESTGYKYKLKRDLTTWVQIINEPNPNFLLDENSIEFSRDIVFDRFYDSIEKRRLTISFEMIATGEVSKIDSHTIINQIKTKFKTLL